MKPLYYWLVECALGSFLFLNATVIAGTPISASAMKVTALNCSLDQAEEISAAFLLEIVVSLEKSGQELSDTERARVLEFKGLIEYKKKNVIEAERYFTEAIQLKEDHAFVFWLRAKCRVEMNDFDRAKDDCVRSISIKDDFAQAYLTLAALYLKESDIEKAGPLLERIQKMGCKKETAYLNYLFAIQALKANNPSQVIHFANLALSSNATHMPASPKAIWELKLLAALALKDSAEIRFSAKHVLELSPNDVRALQSLWKFYRDEGNLLASLNVAEKLVALDPENEKYQICRMVSMVDMKQIKAAEEIAAQIFAKNPDCKSAVEVLEKIRIARTKATEEYTIHR